jgi:hypothetical protein
MIEPEKINIVLFFLDKPAIFQIRNIEEYRLFLESYCLGKQLDYFHFRVEFEKFLIKNNPYGLKYNETTNYPNWVTIIRFSSSSDDQISLSILKRELKEFIEQNKHDKKNSAIFSES